MIICEKHKWASDRDRTHSICPFCADEEFPDERLAWTAQRREQLEILRGILRDAGSLNRGSHIVEKIQRLERNVEALDGDLLNGPTAFLSFLEDLAIAENRKLKQP